MKKVARILLVLTLAIFAAARKLPSQAKAVGEVGNSTYVSQQPNTSNPAFLLAADEVLKQMSVILDLPIKEPLKKSLRSRQEIREYLVREEKEDRDANDDDEGETEFARCS